MSKKILHIISSLKVGGAEHMLVDIIEGLRQDTHQSVIYFHDGLVRHQIEKLGISTRKINGLLCLYDPIFIIRLTWAIFQEKPTKILSSLWAANFFARIIGFILQIPVYITIHAQPEHEGRVRNILDSSTLNCATKIIPVGENIADHMQKLHKLSPEKILVVHNGITLPSISFIRREHLALNPTDFILGTVGRLVPVKNFELILRAANIVKETIPNLRIIIIGHGPEEQKLHVLAKNLGIHDLIMWLKSHDARDYYQIFDIFVQPSWSEGLSRALLEALSYKIPVIVSGKKHKHEIITHEETGLLIDPAQLPEFVNAVRLLYHNKKLRKRLSSAGHALVRDNYSHEIMIKHYRKILGL